MSLPAGLPFPCLNLEIKELPLDLTPYIAAFLAAALLPVGFFGGFKPSSFNK